MILIMYPLNKGHYLSAWISKNMRHLWLIKMQEANFYILSSVVGRNKETVSISIIQPLVLGWSCGVNYQVSLYTGAIMNSV